MRRPLLCALLVACLVAAVPAGAVPLAPTVPPASGPPAAGDIEMLSLDAPARTGITTQGLDVATAVAVQREAAAAELDRRSLEVAFERADGEQPRRELLFEAATEVEISISGLRSAERDLRERYVGEEVSTAEFIRRQAVMEARAAQLRLDLETILTLAEDVPRFSMRSRARTLDASLTGFAGPVTTRAAGSISGEQPPMRLYVSASVNGTALSMLADTEYVRQGFRSDSWVPDSSTGLGLDEIEARAGELYPVAFNSTLTTSRGIEIVDSGIHRVEIGYEGGSIVAYVDGDTRDVFHEVQRRPLDLVEPGPSVTTTENGTRLLVNRTFAGGPLRVTVVDNATGEPAEATVLVGGSEVTTGPDGVAWALMPAEETRVTAITADGRASLLVAPNQSSVAGGSPSLATAPVPPAAEPK